MHGDPVRWGWQYRIKANSSKPGLVYYPPGLDCYECQKEGVPAHSWLKYCKHRDYSMPMDVIIEHFSQELKEEPRFRNWARPAFRGSLGIYPMFADERVKFFCIDADYQKNVDFVREKILPIYRREHIEYIEELGFDPATSEEKIHIWGFCNTVRMILNKWFEWILHEAGASNWKDNGISLEFFPMQKARNFIRPPGAVHAKTGVANDILFRGIRSNDAEFIIESVVACLPVPESQMLEGIKKLAELFPPEEVKPQIALKKSYLKKFDWNNPGTVYSPLDLCVPELPADMVFPPFVENQIRNCPAQNALWHKTISGEFLKKGDDNYHDWAIFMSHSVKRSDGIQEKLGEEPQGEQFLEQVIERFMGGHYRFDHHGGKRSADSQRIPACSTWEKCFRNLQVCGTCPHKAKGLRNPVHLASWTSLERNVIPGETKKLGVREEISQQVFQTSMGAIGLAVGQQKGQCMVFCPPQESGKSRFVDVLAAALVNYGLNVLIAAHSGEVGKEHRECINEELRKWGSEKRAFMLGSRENLFSTIAKELECPQAKRIDGYAEAGITRTKIVRECCVKCPLVTECPYPRQYKELQDPKFGAVIIMHAHLQNSESLRHLLSKTFQIMIVDENFMEVCFQSLIPQKPEMEIYAQLRSSMPWLDEMMQWINLQKNADQILRPDADDLVKVNEYFRLHGVENRTPKYLSTYNARVTVRAKSGIQLFNPMLQFGAFLYADATPVKSAIRTILDKEVSYLGDDWLLDVKRYNPENEVIQLLDARNSRSFMSSNERTSGILNFIAKRARNEDAGKQILVTTFADQEKAFLEFFKQHYPDIADLITVGHAAVGTNSMAHFQVQYLLGGWYLNALEEHKLRYKFGLARNYHRRKEQLPALSNPDPYAVYDELLMTAQASKKQPVPVCRWEYSNVPGQAELVEYPQFKRWIPAEGEDYSAKVGYEFAVAKRQQAIRVRFADGRPRTVFIWDNDFYPGFVITQSVMEQDLIGKIEAAPKEILVG